MEHPIIIDSNGNLLDKSVNFGGILMNSMMRAGATLAKEHLMTKTDNMFNSANELFEFINR